MNVTPRALSRLARDAIKGYRSTCCTHYRFLMPQPIMSATADRRFFLCSGHAVVAAQLDKYPDRHVMGELCYREYKGSKVTVLARWDVSVSTKDDMPVNPDIDMYLIGDARDIKCRCPGCANKGRWEMGKAAIKLIIKTYVAE